MPEKKHSSHLGAGLIAGAILGVAAGLFLQSKKGKQMTKAAQAKAAKLQGKILKQLKETKIMTKEKYEELVDQVMNYYVTSKEVAKAEIPAIRAYLMKSWNQVSKQLKSLK